MIVVAAFLVTVVPIVFTAERHADLKPSRASAKRAARDLGWRAETGFDAGIRRYVEWVSGTNGSPSAASADVIAGTAAAVARQDPADE